MFITLEKSIKYISTNLFFGTPYTGPENHTPRPGVKLQFLSHSIFLSMIIILTEPNLESQLYPMQRVIFEFGCNVNHN